MATSYEGRLGTAPEEAIKAPCVVAATSNITLSGEQTIGAVSVVAGNRVLVAGQTDASENGIYDAAAGAWTRAKDWNDAQDVVYGQLVTVPNAIYYVTFNGTLTIGTTDVTFTELTTVATSNTVYYDLATSAAANSHSLSAGGRIVTAFHDSNRAVGSGGIFKVTGTTTAGKAGNWPDADGYFYDADGRQAQVQGDNVSLAQFGAIPGGSTTVTYNAWVAAEAHCFVRKGLRLEVPVGEYDQGASNNPFRNSVTTALRDYEGTVIWGHGRASVVKTSDLTGADVFQLQAVKGLTIRDLAITAVTPTNTAGSNGVSITSGGVMINILDVYCYDLVGLDVTTNLDGGKAVTIQTQASDVNALKDVRIRAHANNCGYGFGMDADYANFDVDAASIDGHMDVDVDVYAEDCWRGVTLSAAAPLSTTSDTDIDAQVRVHLVAMDCAQDLVCSRWVRPTFTVHATKVKAKASMFRPLAVDQTVYGVYMDGCYAPSLRYRGRAKEVDYKLQIGGAQMGGFINGATRGAVIDMEMEAATINTAEVNVINSGGNTTNQCDIRLRKFASSFPAATSVGQLASKETNRISLEGSTISRHSSTLTAATVTLTHAQTDTVFLLYRLAGIVITLPEVVEGVWYGFYVVGSVTSNNYSVIVDDTANDSMMGMVLVTAGADDIAPFVANAGTHDNITMNGSTTGGMKGTYFTVMGVSPTQWLVEGTLIGSGTQADPFSST